MTVQISHSTEGVDWDRAKVDLAADDFDNGRSPEALRRSFESSQHVAVATDGGRVVGMARLLSDGVCNAYLLDVWTLSSYRRRGIASSMVRQLAERVPGQHIAGGRHLARQRCRPARGDVKATWSRLSFFELAVPFRRTSNVDLGNIEAFCSLRPSRVRFDAKIRTGPRAGCAPSLLALSGGWSHSVDLEEKETAPDRRLSTLKRGSRW
jgi:GNAT superfamily N-acetyltransferase